MPENVKFYCNELKGTWGQEAINKKQVESVKEAYSHKYIFTVFLFYWIFILILLVNMRLEF